MDLEEAVARAEMDREQVLWVAREICLADPEMHYKVRGEPRHVPFDDCSGPRQAAYLAMARAAIKAVESYRVPEFRREGGG
jgi:hypothetical protein